MEKEPASGLSLKKLRRKAREVALQVLYQKDITQESLKTTWNFFCEHYHPLSSTLEYAWELAQGVCKHQTQIDILIEHYAKRWRVERISPIDRNILRIAIYEMLFIDDVPPKVSINEAVELAKTYGTESSGAFVNGILDAFYHKKR
ncbi:MAG: transcription antitermination factor NusB [Candidatus Desulfofervidaceae bacterium]|nr:transcription antitermination factor NusB [Candidatus Desulfofervidaceae bacterium]MDL1969418.1 transcription antitermination factor NusB [Candidatus Desulfofervidaceae bacterium]